MGLFGAECAGGGEKAGVDRTTIVQQVAYGYLKFFGFVGRGRGGIVEGGGRLGGTGPVGWGGVYEGGGSGGNTKGTKASEESGDIAGIGDSECVLGAVVMEREAEKFGGDGVGFDVVQGGQARDKKSEVRGVVVLDAEVVHDQDKGNRARGVAEKTGGKGLMEIERLK